MYIFSFNCKLLVDGRHEDDYDVVIVVGSCSSCYIKLDVYYGDTNVCDYV